jgi:uncharacterized protein YqjF (DUF2071 family)
MSHLGRHVLQRHPIPMSCHFEHSLVLAYALPAEVLAPLVPRGLELDTYDDRWGFVAIAVVQTRGLRPTRLPAVLGGDQALTGYRIFVRHRDARGRTRRGLHVLRSDTDRCVVHRGGNVLTHYRYRRAAIDVVATDRRLAIRIASHRGEADLDVMARLDEAPAELPASSPFRSMRDARRFAGPLPWTFDREEATDSIVVVHGHRTAWRPHPVAVEVSRCTFLDRAPFAGHGRLANAFHVADIDYGWERGRCEPIALAGAAS